MSNYIRDHVERKTLERWLEFNPVLVRDEIVLVELETGELRIKVGETFQLSFSSSPNDATLVFESEDENVAFVDDQGNVTGIAAGETKINASARDEEVSCQVTVYEEEKKSSLAFLSSKIEIFVDGSEKQLTVLHNGIAVQKGEVIFEVADETIAQVDENGVVSAVKQGETLVTAKYANETATCQIIVKDIFDITLDKKELFLREGEQADLEAIVHIGAQLSKLETPEIEWQLEDSSIVELTYNKNIATLKGKSGGITKLTASYEGQTISATISVAQTVSTLDELITLSSVSNAYIILGADIDVSGAKWNITDNLTVPSSIIPEMKAVLDGNGKKISGMTLTTALKDSKGEKLSNIGFIGRITGRVSNLIFDGSLGATSSGCTTCGDTDDKRTVERVASVHLGLFAWENAGIIENCYIRGQIYSYMTYHELGSATLGVIYINTGTMKNTLTDIRVEKSLGTVGAENNHAESAEWHNAFAFAVSNKGTVENCVTVMEQWTEKVSQRYSGVRIWTTSSVGTEPKGTTSYSWGAPFVTLSMYPSIANLSNQGYAFNEKTLADIGRKNCYIFEDYSSLMLKNGVGYNDDYQFETGTVGGVYIEKTGVDGQTALGAAWSFDAEKGEIRLCGTVVWSGEVEDSIPEPDPNPKPETEIKYGENYVLDTLS